MNWGLPELRARAEVFLDGAREAGLAATLWRRGTSVTAGAVLWLVLLPLTVFLHVVGFRRLTVITGRIGHLAAEVDCFLKSRALGELPRRRWFLVAPPGCVANEHLMQYWSTRIAVVRSPLIAYIALAMSRWLLMKYDVSHYVLRLNATQDIYRINAKWRGRPPVLALTPADNLWSESALAKLGIPPGGWFVCVHVREEGFSPSDDRAHAHRNASPDAVTLAMEEIVRRGGWCVRMGDPSMSRLRPMPGVVDYAHHPLRSERYDVVLCAKARFFLGNTSGLALVSSAFGVPSALVNMIPMSALAPLPGDLSIPKLLVSKADSRVLTFREVLQEPAGDFRYAALYEVAEVRPVENDPEDIRDLVVEMLDRLAGCFADSVDDDVRQRRFTMLLRPGHYSYGAASRVGTVFLRKYEHLLA